MKSPLALMFYFGMAVGEFIQKFKHPPKLLKISSRTYAEYEADKVKPILGDESGHPIKIVRDDSVPDGEVEAA